MEVGDRAGEVGPEDPYPVKRFADALGREIVDAVSGVESTAAAVDCCTEGWKQFGGMAEDRLRVRVGDSGGDNNGARSSTTARDDDVPPVPAGDLSGGGGEPGKVVSTVDLAV